MIHTRWNKFNLAFVLWSTLAYSSNESQDKLRDYFFSPSVTSLNISDWYNPTIEDYRIIQDFLRKRGHELANAPVSSRPFSTDYLNANDGFYGGIIYRFNRYEMYNLVEEGDDAKLPQAHIVYCNNDPNNKKNCVVCYITAKKNGADPHLERDYARSLNLIIESLKKHNFNGHFIYYIGGWPGVKKGRLKYIDVPYSFKPFILEEAGDLGYENVLWIDACCVPVKNMDIFFQLIQDNGLCFVGYGDTKRPWNEFNRGYASIIPSVNLNKSYRDITSQVVGINMKHPRGRQLLDGWIKAVEEKVPFLQSDEPPFVFLVTDLDLLYAQLPTHFFVETRWGTGNFEYWHKNPWAILYHQYDFMTPKFPIPADLLDH